MAGELLPGGVEAAPHADAVPRDPGERNREVRSKFQIFVMFRYHLSRLGVMLAVSICSSLSFPDGAFFHSAFAGEFTHHKDEGTYTCVVCGAQLFRYKLHCLCE